MACVAVAVAVAGNGGPAGDGGQRIPATLPGGTPAPLPPYFIGLYSDPGNDLFSDLAVYDAATGAVVTDIASRTQGLTFTAVAATASSTEFLAAAEPVSDGGIGCGATKRNRARLPCRRPAASCGGEMTASGSPSGRREPGATVSAAAR